MPLLPRNGQAYPAQGQSRGFGILERLYKRFANIFYAHREDRNILLLGGGTLAWNAGTHTLTFSADIILRSPITGFNMVVSQATYSPMTIYDGQAVYATLTRAPGATVQLTPVAANTVPSTDNSLLLCVRQGDFLIWRNGRGFDDGDSGPLYNPAAGATPVLGYHKYIITVATNGHTWMGLDGVGAEISSATQGGLTAGFADAIFVPDAVNVFFRNTLCHYTTDVTTKSPNYWRWVGGGAPANVIQLGSTGTTPLLGDIVTIQFPY